MLTVSCGYALFRAHQTAITFVSRAARECENYMKFTWVESDIAHLDRRSLRQFDSKCLVHPEHWRL